MVVDGRTLLLSRGEYRHTSLLEIDLSYALSSDLNFQRGDIDTSLLLELTSYALFSDLCFQEESIDTP